MTQRHFYTIVVGVLLVVFGCYRDNDPNLPPVWPDYPADGQIVVTYADDSPEALGSPCGRACSNLKALGCPEGKSSLCYRACVKQASLERIPVTCWTNAKTQDAARACDRLRCLP